jgi:hypothetical protein
MKASSVGGRPLPGYQSPLKKLKSVIKQHERKVIDTIDGKLPSAQSPWKNG